MLRERADTGNGDLVPNLLCPRVPGGVAAPLGSHVRSGTWQAMPSEPVVVPKLWRAKQEYLPTSRTLVCAICFQMESHLGDIPDAEIARFSALSEDELEAELSDPEPTDPKDRASWLWQNGYYPSPAAAAAVIGYVWTDADQGEHERRSYIRPSVLDRTMKALDAIRRGKQEQRELGN